MNLEKGTNPCPGAGPGIAFDKDGLRGSARRPDAVDGRLVEPEHQRVVHVVILVVGVEDDLVVGSEELGGRGPPGLEAVGVGDDLVVIPAWPAVNAGLLTLSEVEGFIPKLCGSRTA